MPMTVVITCNSPPRVRGFLASLLLEVSPGTYAHPKLSAAVRKRVWRVLREWFRPGTEESISMIWADSNHESGLRVEVLGHPAREFVNYDGFMLSRLRPKGDESLQTLNNKL